MARPTEAPSEASHETAFVRAFVRREKRGRLLELLAKPSRRLKFRERLCQLGDDLDPRYVDRLPSLDADAATRAAERWLRERGAPNDAYVFSVYEEDLEVRPLREVLQQHLDCTVLSCVPGVLAYYLEEGDPRPYMLHRRSSR